jgi:membrane protein implicated in regulation of membrane protease activity
MAVPLWFGIKARLYRHAVIGAVVILLILFLPVNFFLLVLLSGGAAWLFLHLIRKKDDLQKEAAEHKRKVAEERKRESLGSTNEGVPSRLSSDEIWSPSLIESLNSEEEENG